MASINRLTAKQVPTLPKGLHGDGGNLYLAVRSGGSRQWVFGYRSGGRQRQLGLGGAGPGGMPLAEARERAARIRAGLRDGIDPLEAKAEAAEVRAAPTFRAVMEEHIARAEPSWKNPKSAAQWRASLETHARSLLDAPVDRITVDHVIAVLDPIWHAKPETAKRVRGRIEAILSVAKTKKLRAGENPAAWRDNLKNVYRPKPKLVRGHFASMDYEEMPDFMRELRARGSLSALALDWIIVTVSRATVAVTATWSEIDLVKRTWTIPSGRMKGTVEAAAALEDQVVPLSPRALEILGVAGELRLGSDPGQLLFPSQGMKALSLTSLDNVRERMGVKGVTTHGYRASFRTWAAQETFHEAAMAEKALGHLIGDETQRAYQRGDLLRKRRMLMDDWADFLQGALTPERNPFVQQDGAVPKVVLAELARRKSL